MSNHYEFDSRSRTLLSTVEGRIRRLKYKDNALTCILDLTGVTDFDVRSETIRGLAHLPPIFEDPTLRCYCANRLSIRNGAHVSDKKLGLLANNYTLCEP
jgi:hypothetical protein